MPRILTVLTLFLTGLFGQALSAQQVTFDATQGVKIELPANQPNTLQVYVYDQYTNLIINGKFEHFPQGVDESTSKKIRVYGGDLKDEVTLQGFSTVAKPEIYLKGGNDLFVNMLNRWVSVEGGPGNDEINCGNFGSFVSPGPGDDTVQGGAEDDYVGEAYLDESGDDIYILRGGDDTAYDNGGNNYIHLGSGNDFCDVVNGQHTIYGADGNDWMMTNDCRVFANLGAGDDKIDCFYTISAQIEGGDGDDDIIVDMPATPETLFGYFFVDINGGLGHDLISTRLQSTSIYRTIYANLNGGANNDIIEANTSGRVYLNMMGKGGKDSMFLRHQSHFNKDLGGSEVVDGGAGDDSLYFYAPRKDLGQLYNKSSWLGWFSHVPTQRPAPVFIGGSGADTFSGYRWYSWTNYWIYNPNPNFFKIIPYNGATSYDRGKTDYFQDYDPSEGDQELFKAIALPVIKMVQSTNYDRDDDWDGIFTIMR